MRTGKESIIKIEVRVILERLKLAWELGFRQLEEESDKALVVEMMLFGSVANSEMSKLRLVHQLLCPNWKMQLRHIPRHLNVVDSLAKSVIFNWNELQVFAEPPSSIQNILKANLDRMADDIH